MCLHTLIIDVFTGQLQECRSVFDSQSGTIRPPENVNGENTYFDCLWTIRAGDDHRVQLYILTVNIIQGSGECVNSFLQVLRLIVYISTNIQDMRPPSVAQSDARQLLIRRSRVRSPADPATFFR